MIRFNPRPTLRFGDSKGTPTLIHIFTVGASQSGGYDTTPSLTGATEPNVITLTDGPLSPDVSTGTFITLGEGDTYNQDQVPQTYLDVESQAASLGQQLYELINNANYKVCVTVHYRGGTSLQRLNSGGDRAAEGYTQLTNGIARVKALADAEGLEYIPYFIIWTSGSGANPMDDAVTDWIDNVRSFVTPTYYADTVKVGIVQSRITGSPDFGIGAYDGAAARTDANIGFSIRELLPASEIQGDNIHITNHGTRHVGVANAYQVYDDLFRGGYEPLDIDSANISYDDNTEAITVPITGADGALQGTGDFGIVVYDTTAAQTVTGTWAVSGSNIVFTITGNKPSGTSTIEFRVQQGTGTLTDSRSNSRVLFNNASAVKYPIEKPLIRYDHQKSLVFPTVSVTVKINLANTSQTVSGWTTYDSPTFGSSQSYTIAIGTFFRPASGWASGESGPTSGANFTPEFPDEVMQQQWAANSGANNYLEFQGLDTGKTYDIHVLTTRQAGGDSTRTHDYTFDGDTQTIISDVNASDNLTDLASVTNFAPDGAGVIRITDTPTGESFRRINGIIITEN